jgi:hypothetical protein
MKCVLCTVVNFLAEVGGYLGLFLGYSFLHISLGFSFLSNTLNSLLPRKRSKK